MKDYYFQYNHEEVIHLRGLPEQVIIIPIGLCLPLNKKRNEDIPQSIVDNFNKGINIEGRGSNYISTIDQITLVWPSEGKIVDNIGPNETLQMYKWLFEYYRKDQIAYFIKEERRRLQKKFKLW